jgi:glycosyltransferase involved in cell wall biosynthesis
MGSNRRRVLIVEQGEGLWGAQRYLLRLAPLLEERGFDQVLAAPGESAMATAWRSTGRQHVCLEVPATRAVRHDGDAGRPSASLVARELRRTAANSGRIARLARQVRADLIHANSHWSHLESALAGPIARRPVVLHLHEENLPGIAGALRGLSVAIADDTIAVSRAVARCLPPRARARTSVIHNGIDTNTFTPGPPDPALRREIAADPDAPIVLVMCRLDPAKGVDHVIRAVASLPDGLGRVQLAVAGTGSLQPGYAAELHRLGEALLGPRVRFLGPRGDVAPLLRTADALALGSSLEGLPLGILEAQACGTPVVAYPTAGVPEIIRDGNTGLLAQQGDADDLSRCLSQILGSADLRARITAAARSQVERAFSLEGQADRQAELLHRLTGTAATDIARSA